MDTIIIQPKDKKELDLLSEMLKRMKIKIKLLTEEEKEDFALGKAIKSGMKTKSVTKDTILKSLRK